MRRGFTLIELLVATGVFLFGFTAAMALFLLGTRARAQADGMLRLSLAASSIVEEIRLEAGREGTGAPYTPTSYIGDGFAAVDSANIDGTTINEDDNTLAGRLYPYRPQPGIWYRVIGCVDEKGDPADKLATGLRLDLLVVWNPVPDASLTMQALAARQRIDKQSGWAALATPEAQVQYLADFMAKRGFAVRETAWIIRKPSWER
jgi:prepilin-type N-terminal cleavage/methylation domain-containing protein